MNLEEKITQNTHTQFIKGPNGYDLAYAYTQGDASKPGVVFLPGLKSDMQGSKALYLEELAKQKGFSYLRLDYGGHGESGGKFTDGCVGDWFADTLHIIQTVTTGPQIIIGSSMGGWIGLLLAQKHPELVSAFIGIAPAPDFTETILSWLTDEQKQALEEQGYVEEENEYDEPYIFTKHLLEEAKQHNLLDGTIDYTGPVHILQGKLDKSVPWEKAERVKQAIASKDVSITYIEDGDHSMSQPNNLDLLKDAVISFLCS